MIELVKTRGVLQSLESEKPRKTGWIESTLEGNAA